MRKVVKIFLVTLVMLIVLTSSVKSFAAIVNDLRIYNSVSTSTTHEADRSGAKTSLSDIFQYIFKGLAFVYIICTLFTLYELVTGKTNRTIDSIIMVLSIIIVLVGKVYLMIFIPVLLALKGAIKNKPLKILVNIVLILCLILTMYVLWTGTRPVFMNANM